MDAFPTKRSGERLDYTIEVDDWLVSGREIASAVCNIVGASNGESPFDLQFYGSPSAVVSSSGQTSPALNDRVTVHLTDGTPGVTYYLKFTFYDDTSDPVQKIGERYVAIAVIGESSMLVVEDGTQVENANSYVARAEADSYFGVRGDSVWLNAGFTERERALIKATDYLEQKYRIRWKGSRVGAHQPLNWPRRGVAVEDFFDPFFREVNVPAAFVNTLFVAENVVPSEIKKAQILLARASMDENGVSNVDLQADLDRPIDSLKVGPISINYATENQLSDGGRLTKLYWDVEQTIKIYLKTTGGFTGQLVRA